MSTTTLLPCPFCGQQPTEYAIEPHTHVLQFAGGKMPDHQGSHVIECACGCGMIEATREAVVAVWNRRPTPAAVCEVMGLVQDYFVTGTDEARDTIESKLHTLLATGGEAQALQPAIMPKGESAAAQLRAMATNYPTGHNWDKLDAKACIRGALEIEALRAQLATATGLPAQAGDKPEGVHADPYPRKCPITGRPYFMHLQHPEHGLIPTFGGPYDSYSMPYAEGEPTDPWHGRELSVHRYDHDRGHWVEDESIPLRIIFDEVLWKLQEASEAAPLAQADARDAERWRESLSHVYSATKGNGQPIFGISLVPSESLYRSKLTGADQFTKDIDAAIAAAKGE